MIETIVGLYLVITFITIRYAYSVGEKLLKIGAAAGILLLMGTFGREISAIIAIIALLLILKRLVIG